MGRDYNLTVRDAAEFVRDVGFSALQSNTGPTDSHWFLLYKEAIEILHSALKTKGLPEKPSYAPRSQGRRHGPCDWSIGETSPKRVGYGRRKEDNYADRERFDDYDQERPAKPSNYHPMDATP